MKDNVFDFTSKNSDLKTKKLNKTRIVLIVILFILISSVIALLIVYNKNTDFREFWDYTVLRKEVESTDVKSIELKKENLSFSYSYDRKIAILEKNILKCYNSEANVETQFELNVANPTYYSSGKFLVVAEKSGGKVYLINENNMMWQKDLEGTISQVYVNKNGYVGVAMSTTGYKTVIILYTQTGEELFRTFLPTTYCTNMDISSDNKTMAIAELDTSGTMIETVIKVISIEKAKTEPKNAFLGTYNAGSNNMVLNLKYTDSGRLVVAYDNAVYYAGENMEKILDISSDTMFVDIGSNNRVISIKKQNANLLNISYVLNIYNTNSEKNIEYNLKDAPKALYVRENVIVVGYGTDVEIINAQSGWLIKKYVSRQDIKNVLIANGFVGIEYAEQVKLVKI